ncbi:S-adenosyl-L-methionine-dependent methyltransferases superfamily protein [Actinidia rufa]|uniref:Methyltransferase n=1 Tax=Actinidia rufa TaxID=165716 RepID=A0A7J0GHN4_9ERIC|nr:S-adenosyl-L-methionine-dependent methyltransferases superfamily protein [Actinidia rufa]
MAISRFGRQAKRSYGFCVKITAVAVLGLCFILIWSFFSSSSSSVASQRSTFGEFSESVSANSEIPSHKKEPRKDQVSEEDKKSKFESDLAEKDKKRVNGSHSFVSVGEHKKDDNTDLAKKDEEKNRGSVGSDDKKLQKEEGEEEEEEVNEKEEEEAVDGEGKANEESEGDGELVDGDQEAVETVEDESGGSKSRGKKKKEMGPLFDPKAHYSWKLCITRSKHNYVPCIDMESAGGRMQSYRHHERSCPKTPPMCLVPLPQEGYGTPVKWPESKLKVLYKNVAHPKLAAFVKSQSWVVESGEYLTFPPNQTELKGGIMHYLESIEEMVPDIEWGKNIRIVLEIGCTDSSFAATLLEKDVLTLTLGLKDDLVDLAQVALERGFPTVVSHFQNKRLPFPSGVFDAIHCGECRILWHSNGGKLLLEMNRLLRPGGYFILSTQHDSIEAEEAMTTLTASICWNILAHKTDEIGEVGVKIYQKPESNDIYELRRKNHPPLCKENENPDATWYVPIKSCLDTIPSAIEQRGNEWPAEWPKRLDTFPEWITDREKLIADTEHWKAIVDKSYLKGMDIDWSNIRNIMDMKAINGGFAAALTQQNVWVMNVVPMHAPNTLPIIFERGLLGIYHDWCESFGTYPRSYDLLHADHLFSRLKNRCKQPVAIVVEMDRLLRPGGWAILRDKVEILDPLEGIFRTLHWEIRMTYNQDKEGLMCVQKTPWRP